MIGSSTLNSIDYVGESLANFFGITTPKYQFEINYHNNIMQEVSISELQFLVKDMTYLPSFNLFKYF